MKKKNGFTLIELLIVVLILAILAGILVFRYQKVVEESRARKASTMLRVLGTARRMQLLDNGLGIDSGAIRGSWFDGISCPASLSDIDTVPELHACGYGDLKGVDWETMRPHWRACSCIDNASASCAGFASPYSNTIAITWRVGKVAEGWVYYFTDDGGCYAASSDIPACEN
jgi:prepilin-type N-terminal cleavage/methylation domain-containing protein